MAYGTGGLMPHSQGLFNIAYPWQNQLNSSYWYRFLKINANIVIQSTPRPS